MRMRSLLFVPGDRPEWMEKGLHLNADALILDLEDSVAPEAKVSARTAVVNFLRLADRHTRLFVRLNPLGSDFIDADLKAVLDGRPDALVLPKAEGASSIEALSAKARGTAIIPIATETPAAIFQIGTYGSVRQHLIGIGWGAEDLPAAIGASTAREADGRYTPPYELVRSLALFGSHAAGVAALETVYPDFRDLEGLARYARRASRDGFSGMMAIHPAQVPVINEAFTPSAEEVEHARAVVAAFAANPGKGALQLNGRMIDAPHLRQARNVIEAAGVGDS